MTLPARAIKSFLQILTFAKDISVAEQKMIMWTEFASYLKCDFLRTYTIT